VDPASGEGDSDSQQQQQQGQQQQLPVLAGSIRGAQAPAANRLSSSVADSSAVAGSASRHAGPPNMATQPLSAGER
jgi:hypothetical protein